MDSAREVGLGSAVRPLACRPFDLPVPFIFTPKRNCA